MFGRSRKDDQDPVSTAVEPAKPDPQGPKGRATPSRKEAEAARRDARKIPTDPKAAKRAQKERARSERNEARAGMMSGDERYLPPRDQGPVRRYVRDYTDRRRRFSEYFVFIAIGILVAGFIPSPQTAAWISYAWFLSTALIAVEMAWTLTKLNAELKQQWPEKAERKGTMLYGGMRALQIRKLRVPPPQVKGSFRPKS